MKKSTLWAIYVKKYPKFAQEGEITLTTKGLRKFFDTTWDTAYHDGEPEEEDYLDPDTATNLDMLKSIFGMR
jgi:hypothetical protein